MKKYFIAMSFILMIMYGVASYRYYKINGFDGIAIGMASFIPFMQYVLFLMLRKNK